jgi:hypothetical protein
MKNKNIQNMKTKFVHAYDASGPIMRRVMLQWLLDNSTKKKLDSFEKYIAVTTPLSRYETTTIKKNSYKKG